MRSLFVIIVLMLMAHAFAQNPALDLQDSLEYDRLDPSIKEEFEELKKWSAIKDKCILQEYCYNCNVYDVKPYTPYGFTVEAAYAGPSVLSIHLLGYRNFYIKHKVLVGIPLVSADMDFRDGFKISDEGLLGVLALSSRSGNTMIWVCYLLLGNSYLPLTENDRVGLFESHHIIDYLLYDLSSDLPWEFGWSQAAGFRFVYAKGDRDGTYYLDLGANVRWTNRSFRFGVFVQWGITGTHT